DDLVGPLEPELPLDVGAVGLHRLRADEQRLGRLRRREPAPEVLEHLELAVTEHLERGGRGGLLRAGLLGEPLAEAGREVALAAEDGADGLEHLRRRGVLVEEPPRARAQRPLGVERLAVRRHHEGGEVRHDHAELLEEVEPVHPGDREVHDGEVGVGPGDGLEGVGAGFGLAAELEVRLAVEQAGVALLHDGVVLDEEDAIGHRRGGERRTRSARDVRQVPRSPRRCAMARRARPDRCGEDGSRRRRREESRRLEHPGRSPMCDGCSQNRDNPVRAQVIDGLPATRPRARWGRKERQRPFVGPSRRSCARRPPRPVRARHLMPPRLLPAAVLAGLLAAGALAPSVRAQPADDPSTILDDRAFEMPARRGLGLLYNAQFAEARAAFDTLAARYPDHPAAAFLRALVPWWEILLDLSDTSRDEAFYDAMDEVVRLADRRLRRDEYDLDARFFKGAALAFRARLRANRRDYVRAAFDAKGALDYVLDVARRDPANA